MWVYFITTTTVDGPIATAGITFQVWNYGLITNMRYKEEDFMFDFFIAITLDSLYTVSIMYTLGGHIHE